VDPEVDRPSLPVRIHRTTGEFLEHLVQSALELLHLFRREAQAQPGALQACPPNGRHLFEEGLKSGIRATQGVVA